MQNLKPVAPAVKAFADKVGMVYEPLTGEMAIYYDYRREAIGFDEARKLSPLCWQSVSTAGDVFTQRIIVCAALRFPHLDLVIPGARHYSEDIHRLMNKLKEHGLMPKKREQAVGENQGFLDNFGNYWNREDALVIARAAHQLDGKEKSGSETELFSEDLY